MEITRTRQGLRLSQHGVVLSELRTSPGPTHSVFDVLAAAIAGLAPAGRIGILGFAGGSVLAPLRALGVDSKLEAVDLERAGYDLFRRHCAAWAGRLHWRQAEAGRWLGRQAPEFGLLLDDLSVPSQGDVIKPELTWTVLPELVRARLRPGGRAVFNLLPPTEGNWGAAVQKVAGVFGSAHLIHLDDFENRILVAGADLPSARMLGDRLRAALRQLRSRQASRIQVRRVPRR